jgi:hypothetical protein
MNNIVKSFNDKTIPIRGCVSIYGKYFGKPGDTISTINDISIVENILVIILDSKKIEIKSPRGISISSSPISIESSEGLIYDGKKYDKKSSEKAFALFTW